MKKNPRLDIDLYKISHNTKSIINMCRRKKITVVGITKGCSADEKVAKAMVKGGIRILGDSRLKNIKKIRESKIDAEIMLIRIPMQSEIEEIIEYTDISLNSEFSTIQKLSDIAKEKNKKHKIILMVEMGDLREGILPEKIGALARKVINLPMIEFLGIGANFSCVSGVLPTTEKLNTLVSLAKKIERKENIKIKIISGGSTSALKLLEDNGIPEEVNQLRIGTGILIGQDDIHLQSLKGTFQDAFILTAEIIEIKIKPSFPKGKIGRDAFGNIPEFKDIGLRKRAILALGKQDIYLNGITPVKEGIRIIGASSDHLIVDVTNLKDTLEVGDKMRFYLNYPAILKATTSKYIYKYYN